MAVQLTLTDVNTCESLTACSHNNNGPGTYLHSQDILHCYMPCLCITVVTEAANMLQTSATLNGQPLLMVTNYILKSLLPGNELNYFCTVTQLVSYSLLLEKQPTSCSLH